MKVVGAQLSSAVGQSSSLQQQAYDLLKQMIEDGRIKPGERLLEAEIVRAFGISRSPARHALQALCRAQIVLDDAGRGYRVAGAPVPDASRPVALQPIQVSQPRQWERMYDKVEEQIYSKVLFDAVRINDQRLAEHFGVSRTVSRDLLARMHGVGLITKDESGHWIADRVTPERIRHLFELRQLLEPPSLLQAAGRLPRPFLEAVRENVQAALATDPIDSAAFDQVEIDLHMRLLAFAPNAEILAALRRTHLLFGPTRHLVDPLLGIPMIMIEDALQEHLTIIDLLMSGKPRQAEAALRKHLSEAEDRWPARFEKADKITAVDYPPYLAPLNRPK